MSILGSLGLDEKSLYYQWLIDNNSTSTMLKALSGTDQDSSGAFSAVSGIQGLGSSWNLTGLNGSVLGTDSTNSFANILQAYMSMNNTVSGIAGNSAGTGSVIEAASMAEKLSDVLEEASKTEDQNSLTYKTVQEIYEYFSGQVSQRAKSLLGITGSSGAETEKTSSAKASGQGQAAQDIDVMNRQAVQGKEYDFSFIDSIVDNSFGEQTPLT